MPTYSPLIVANWKMHMTPADIDPYMQEISKAIKKSSATVAIAAPYPLLHFVTPYIHEQLLLAAQDVSTHEYGAYTGEVAAEHLRDARVQMVLVGHSERRAHHHETNQEASEKIARALAVGITPIYCIGETQQEHDDKKTFDILDTQLREGLATCTEEQKKSIVIAYEPVWAIGTGRTPSSHEIQETHEYIQSVVGEDARIVYGGSVNANSAQEILALNAVAGVLVGGASLRSTEFAQIIRSEK